MRICIYTRVCVCVCVCVCAKLVSFTHLETVWDYTMVLLFLTFIVDGNVYKISFLHRNFFFFLANTVEGDPNAPFSIATTPRCQGGRYSFPKIAPLYPWPLPYNTECYARRNQVPFFESLVWLDPGLNPGLPGH